jgi:histidinol-phosphate aminotransferase
MAELPLARLVPDYIKNFEAYIPSKPDAELKKIYKCNHLFRLNNNENPLGPPPKARKIIEGFPPDQAAIYPSGDSYYLRYKLAEKFGKHPDQFIVGNGANEVIAFVIKAFCREGDNIITADKTFAVYEWVAEFSGFEARLIPLVDFGFDDVGMLKAIDDRTKILFICNPNNPTGTYWNETKFHEFMAAVNGEKIVVLDEAYYEFVEKDDYPDGMKLIDQYPNLIVFRTFSKMYGLASLRIGYMAGSIEVVDIVRKTCVVYSVNSIAQEAAFSAIEDDEHIIKTRKLISAGKEYLKKELDLLKLQYVIGEASYIMIKLPISDSLAYRKLMSQGIMIRSMTGFRFPNYIRVTISEMYMMEAFIEALSKII